LWSKTGDAAGPAELQLDFQVGRGKESGGTLRPLDDAERIRTEVLPEPRAYPFFLVFEPIKIKMI